MSFPTRTCTTHLKSEIWTEQAQNRGCLGQESPPASPQAFLIKSTANEELVTTHLRGAAPTCHMGRADLTLPQTVTWSDRQGKTPANTNICEG